MYIYYYCDTNLPQLIKTLNDTYDTYDTNDT